MSVYNLPSGNEVIGSLIGEFIPGEITTIYGNAASGKTTSCLLAAISAVKGGGKVIYMDTEKGFNITRIEQLSPNTSVLDNIFLIRPNSFADQHGSIVKMVHLCRNPKIRLVIVDTIGNFYRAELSKENDREKISSMLMTQARALHKISEMNKIVIITSQVYSSMKDDSNKIVGGRIILRRASKVIELRKDNGRRFAFLPFEKDQKKRQFEIREKGMFLLY